MKIFRLQALLDYRKRQADRAHEMLAASMKDRTRIAGIMEQTEQEILELRGELEKAKKKKVPAVELMLHEEFIRARNRNMRELEDRLARAEKDVEEKRRELVKARQKKRALELLKEKSEQEREKKQKHMENVFLDEVAVTGFGGRG